MAWDVTVLDTYADSHLADTATTAGAAADKAASKVRQWMHVGCMDYPAAEALPDNNVTVI